MSFLVCLSLAFIIIYMNWAMGSKILKTRSPWSPRKRMHFISKGPKGFIALKIIVEATFFLTIIGKYCKLSKGASLRRITKISNWGNQLLMGRTWGKQQLVEYSIQIQLLRDLAKIFKKITQLVMGLGRAWQTTHVLEVQASNRRMAWKDLLPRDQVAQNSVWWQERHGTKVW